jgi:hypothetical protein
MKVLCPRHADSCIEDKNISGVGRTTGSSGGGLFLARLPSRADGTDCLLSKRARRRLRRWYAGVRLGPICAGKGLGAKKKDLRRIDASPCAATVPKRGLEPPLPLREPGPEPGSAMLQARWACTGIRLECSSVSSDAAETTSRLNCTCVGLTGPVLPPICPPNRRPVLRSRLMPIRPPCERCSRHLEVGPELSREVGLLPPPNAESSVDRCKVLGFRVFSPSRPQYGARGGAWGAW